MKCFSSFVIKAKSRQEGSRLLRSTPCPTCGVPLSDHPNDDGSIRVRVAPADRVALLNTYHERIAT